MAERDLTAGMATAVQADVIYPVLFFEGTFLNADTLVEELLNLWTGAGSYSWDGKTWLGDGQMVAISPLAETVDLEAKGFAITVSGLPSSEISRALGSMRKSRNQPGRLWLGLFDSSGALIADPYELQRGRFSHPRILDSGDKCTIEVQYQSVLAMLGSSEERRYTDEDQQLDYPTDRGFEQVPALQDAEFPLWAT